MAEQPEYVRTERPLIEQLTAMGWTHLRGGPAAGPATASRASDRTSFETVVYADRFKSALARINPRPSDGEPWLSDAQLDRLLALVQGTTPGQGPREHGVAGNLEVTDLLRKGLNARTLPGWTKGDPEHVRLVDWDGEFGEHPDTPGGGNDLLVVSQFRVERKDAPPVTPDLVLFVNGLPWVVIECKAPVVSGPLGDVRAALDEAVDQVLRYAGVNSPAAVPEFVRFAQVLVATDRDHAETGTVTAEPRHFAPWRTVAPVSEDLVREEVRKPASAALTDQEILVAGMLRPAHLLDLVRDFTTRLGSGQRTVKLVGRHQQFKAVKALTRKLEERDRQAASGVAVGHRGGVVWHTQGSGKSLTMAFLVRHLRSRPALKSHKVVVVTDRIDLEKQIRASLAATEEKVHRAPSVKRARKYLEVDVGDVVLVTLQKAQRDDTVDDGREESLPDAAPDDDDVEDGGEGEGYVQNRVANPHHHVVVLIDEAHRGQDKWQAARWRAMLPRAAFVGFTGTPVISDNRKRSEEIFGPYADTYTLRDAELDRSVVPVRYEAYAVPLEVIEQAALDARFDEKVPSDPKLRAEALRKFGRRKEILEAPSVIEAKAEHMLDHWARTALPDRFGAQIATVSRLAAVRYHTALLAARDRLVARLDALDPALTADPMAALEADDEERALLMLLPDREVLRTLDAAVVISQARQGGSDPETWRPWITKSHQDAHIERFKKGLPPRDITADPAWNVRTHGLQPSGIGTPASGGQVWNVDLDLPADSGPPAPPDTQGGAPPETMAFLVVQSMLLTGFDAPVEQVLYLDCKLSGAGLLQAVARTNRPYPAKKWGQVVDYIGIGPELAGSLASYDQEHLRHVLGYRNVSVDHLQPDYQGPQPDGRSPDRDGLLLRSDAAAKALLEDLAAKVTRFLAGQNVTDPGDESQWEDFLGESLDDPLRRGEFDERVRDFLTALNAVLPDPEALKYRDLAGQLGTLQYMARRRYLDGREQFSPRRYGAKVRRLISQHIETTGIRQRIPPVELTDPEFMERVDANADPRARCSYMTGSLKLRITAKIGGDRAGYQRFSVRLEEIIARMQDDFEQAAADLKRLVGDVAAAEREPEDGDALDSRTERLVLGLLQQHAEEAERDPWPPGTDLIRAARGLTREMSVLVRRPQIHTQIAARNRIRSELCEHLEIWLDMDWDDIGDLASHLTELAVERSEYFLGYQPRDEADGGDT
ncbi:type I restriction endonuclease [Streptomyces sp. ID05-04B]|uniref:type I restriction endonuclease subunit R n=1 Tax=unclassified Streptomyces TaxID=2593676 RepID=UPI0020B12948|nr:MULTISPECIES: type I restriction endonuclease [unclassified Streptomyces]MDX5562485.1 type I restriction endonuclease [Streptomyces sp. ID05-04B]